MKHIKPGRAPSMMSGVVGIFMIGFGILWTVITAQFFPLFAIFGILWTGIAVVNTVYDFKNATSKNRYSQFDITDSSEEPDPLNQKFGTGTDTENMDSAFCPYCGAKVEDAYKYCNKCGKELP